MEEVPLDIILSTICHENKDPAEKSSKSKVQSSRLGVGVGPSRTFDDL
jgi:hypothetical protein